jgi:hypothetical protein
MKLNLFCVSSVAMVFGLCGVAFAQESNSSDLSTILASARSSQVGEVDRNDIDMSGDLQSHNSIDNVFTDAEGLFNLQQNTGENSLQQSSNTLAKILNCNCSSGVVNLGAVSVGRQLASIQGNRVDFNGRFVNTASSNLISDLSSASGLVNVQQNTGNNSIQQSSNTVALIVGK